MNSDEKSQNNHRRWITRAKSLSLKNYGITIGTRAPGSFTVSKASKPASRAGNGRHALVSHHARIARSRHTLFHRVLGLILLALSGFGFSSRAWAATDILVLQSHDSEPYRRTFDGFKSDLIARGMNADCETQVFRSDAETEALSQRLRNRPPQLIVTLGTPATRAVLALERTIPVIAGLVLDTDELRKYPNATGVGLNFPATLHWSWLRHILPEARQIAVIYDPQHGSALFQALQQQAHTESTTLIAAPAKDPEDLPALLQSLPPQLDAIWAVDGAAPFNSAAVRELLLYSFRNRTPLIGLSAQWVKAGALYALDWDYADLGAQIAELAGNVLQKSTAPSALTPQEPRKVRPVVNSRTAEHMKLQISERWLPEIAEVFR